jgi:hypothetical protein
MVKSYIVFAFLCFTVLGEVGCENWAPSTTTTTQVPYTTTTSPYLNLTSDALKVCEEKCEDYCVKCKEPVRCKEGQRNCGVKPIDPKMSQCSTDDICVPGNCECQYITLQTYHIF